MVDEHHGKGGTYEVNPKTGKRTLVEGSRTESRPKQAEPEADATPEAAAPKAPEPAPETTSQP